MTGPGGVTRRTGLRTALAAAVAVPLLATVRASAARRAPERTAAPPPLEVMSYNLRFASPTRPHSWPERRPVMRELLRRAAPHVIGTQEGQGPQLADVESDLGPHYDWLGTGRDGGEDESAAVFYDRRRLVPVGHGDFWLSDTPGRAGSNTWGGAHPRMVTWVRFQDRAAGGRPFCVLNTHLDNGSAYARGRAAALIAERVPGLAGSAPLVVTGDFNAIAHESPAHATLLGAGLVDTWDAARSRGPAYGTWHGWGAPAPGGDRIDWILATPDVTVLRAWVDLSADGGQWPSDHFPVCASLRLPAAPE
ncbi:endonuclease/exonuclease/phosphatase family protein [Streptomyces longwoodensis]|uniref:endonuclease/exonuclease/phosphatase family protein n=1 Tax=Streptomyces longwoodensis TaxID=68231 RepID=UPI002DDA01E8|nr:endonuclease/exonuclease/phosphatase family protein [Streptomyces longwoodensis]WRY87117.1 endonuclease/exonuclease/phosphatase family protein [Streptomyces longwoodensis]WUC74772.1 endonuclease/exonuclease/phosphatase family protein [Streptomyces longwoodensis]